MSEIVKPNKIYVGNSLDVLRRFKEEQFYTCVTSPPYFNLRYYNGKPVLWDGDPNCDHEWIEYIRKGISGGPPTKKMITKGEVFQRVPDSNQQYCQKCGGIMCDLGNEPTIELYIKHLCDIFDEVYRVLKPDGTLWVNLGDSYAGSGNGQTSNSDADWFKNSLNRGTIDTSIKSNGKTKVKDVGVPDKSLMLIPYRFALEMLNRGWILRNACPWVKPNPMPHPVKDRYTNDHEMFFFFSKQQHYYFKQQLEPVKIKNAKGMKFGGNKAKSYGSRRYSGNIYDAASNGNMRNKRETFICTTSQYKGNHTAVFPKKLIRSPIDACCPEWICNKCGKPREYVVEKTLEDDEEWKKQCGADSNGEYNGTSEKDCKTTGAQNPSDLKRNILNGMKKKNIYWTDCGCNAGFTSGIVLDIFGGSGTVAEESISQNKKFVLIEINREYAKLAYNRIKPSLSQSKIKIKK